MSENGIASSISDDKSRGEVVCSGLQYLCDESIKSIYLRLSVLGKGNYNSGGRTGIYAFLQPTNRTVIL